MSLTDANKDRIYLRLDKLMEKGLRKYKQWEETDDFFFLESGIKIEL